MSLTEPGIQAPAWRKARRSVACGECVEVAPADGGILVRDSKSPGSGMLGYPVSTWRSFLSSAKQGQFDVLRLLFTFR